MSNALNNIPQSGFLRVSQLIADPKRPDKTPILPFSRSTLYAKIKEGTFPAPVKLGERMSAFTAQSVRDWIAAQEASATRQQIAA